VPSFHDVDTNCFANLLLCWLAGAQRDGIRAQPIFAAILMLICIAVVPAMSYARRMNLRRLDRLDQLLATAE
jgi:hypothetical protein